ncbi:hypothetical protein HK104_001698 [Borealophlyctis nickersoniae]|nr:hypothetical protein HK104_001698 [Borealophlyctis nickersoniae]
MPDNAISEPSRKLQAIMDEAADLLIRSDPVAGVAMFSYPKYHDEIFDVAGRAELWDRLRVLLRDLEALEAEAGEQGLDEKEKTDLFLAKWTIESNAKSSDLYGGEIPASHLLGGVSLEARNLLAYTQLATKEELTNYAARLSKFLPRFKSTIDAFRVGIQKGITLPVESINLMIASCSQQIVENPADSPLNLKDKVVALGEKEDYLHKVIAESVVPAYRALKEFLETEYKKNARKHAGIYGLPNYEKVYEDAIYVSTGLSYKAEELHQIGLDEVARISKQMEEAKRRAGFEGTLPEFRKALNDKERFPQLFIESREEVIPRYRALLEVIDKKMPALFTRFPKFKSKIEAVPAHSEPGAPLAYYQPGTATTPGTFYANLALHGTKPAHQMMAITLHECNPGHHHQISLAFESASAHLIRKLCFPIAYLEGWGLYSEYLGEEMGMYEDALDWFGRLELEMHRALRLVVDTGLHAKGWDVEKGVEVMAEHLSLPRNAIESEVVRYAVWPGQALAYKVGEMKILSLRRSAEQRLGDAFDVRSFHDRIMEAGNVPLSLLEKVVEQWVRERSGV